MHEFIEDLKQTGLFSILNQRKWMGSFIAFAQSMSGMPKVTLSLRKGTRYTTSQLCHQGMAAQSSGIPLTE